MCLKHRRIPEKSVTEEIQNALPMSTLPRGSNILKNDWGTAPGVHLPVGSDKHIFLTAGVPREMKGLLAERIVPVLRGLFPAHQTVLIKSLHSWGIPESTVGERIKPLM